MQNIISQLKSLFERDLPRGDVMHMQDHKGWGNSIQWTDYKKGKVHGHLFKRPSIGDILTCDMESGIKLEFQFIDVEYIRDPNDMFFGSVKFIGEVK